MDSDLGLGTVLRRSSESDIGYRGEIKEAIKCLSK